MQHFHYNHRHMVVVLVQVELVLVQVELVLVQVELVLVQVVLELVQVELGRMGKMVVLVLGQLV
jgi:hypothetical protein